MTELRRFNAVPKIIGQDMNVEYEADPNGQLVFADGAVTLVAELRTEVERLNFQLAEADFNFGGWHAIKNRLEAENARLSAPVSKHEWEHFYPTGKPAWDVMTALIAARKAAV